MSKWFLDKVSHSGDDLEKTHRELEELRPTLNKLSGRAPKSLSPKEQEELAKAHKELTRLTGYQEADVKLYQEAKDNVANTAAAGAAVVVGAAATIATGGAAGPAAAAVIGSLAGGGASIATKLAIKGQDYSTEDLQRDALETGAMALTAGAGQLGSVGKGLNSVLKIGPAGGGILQEAAKGAIIGSVSGAVGAAAGELINRDNYVGEGTFGGKFASHVGHAALAGGLGGGLGAGIGGALGKTAFGRNHGLFGAAVSGAGGGLGGGLTNGLVGGDADLDWQAALSGAIGGIAGAHQANRYHQATHSPVSGHSTAALQEHVPAAPYTAEGAAASQVARPLGPGEAPPTWEEFPHKQQGRRGTQEPEAAALRPQEHPEAAKAIKQPSNFYEGAQVQWDAPVSNEAYGELQPRWKEIEAGAAHLRERQQQGDPSLAQAQEEITKRRISASGTARGEHGGVSGASKTDVQNQAQGNWHEADAFVRKLAQSGEALSVEKLSQINELLGKGLDNNQGTPGQLRKTDAFGGRLSPDRLYVEPSLIKGALNEFVSWYQQAEQQGMHPVELAARAYQRLVSIHPFADANGRTCRMIMDWILQKHGLPPATLVDHEVNVAVFGLAGITGDAGITPEQAIKFVTQGVERTLKASQTAPQAEPAFDSALTDGRQAAKERNKRLRFSEEDVAKIRAAAPEEQGVAQPADAKSNAPEPKVKPEDEALSAKTRGKRVMFSPEDVAKIRALSAELEPPQPAAKPTAEPATPEIQPKQHDKAGTASATDAAKIQEAANEGLSSQLPKPAKPAEEGLSRAALESAFKNNLEKDVPEHFRKSSKGSQGEPYNVSYDQLIEEVREIKKEILANKGEYSDFNVRPENLDAARPHIQNLTDAEAAALRGYSSGDYKALNEVLRHPDKNPELTEKLKPYIKLTESALEKLPPYESDVYRGTTMDKKRYAEIEKAFKEGGRVRDKALVSASQSRAQAETFVEIAKSDDVKAGKEGKVDVLFVIQSKSGRAIDFLSYKSREAEVLFKSDTGFRVTDITTEGGRRVVYLIES